MSKYEKMPDPCHFETSNTHTAKRTDRCTPTPKDVLQSVRAREDHSRFPVQLANFAKQQSQLTRNAPQNNQMHDPPNQPDEPATCKSYEREKANKICLVTQWSGDKAATDARKTPTDAATRVARKKTSDFIERNNARLSRH